ncbi:hypothetical protein R1sor_021513 [Riccia sorocarpa]|uniref:Uncharacterized protein n=1 Tax=Riccia sorocarpa TaxID=122646 RepID=A0ABD3GHA1_9MARC
MDIIEELDPKGVSEEKKGSSEEEDNSEKENPEMAAKSGTTKPEPTKHSSKNKSANRSDPQHKSAERQSTPTTTPKAIDLSTQPTRSESGCVTVKIIHGDSSDSMALVLLNQDELDGSVTSGVNLLHTPHFQIDPGEIDRGRGSNLLLRRQARDLRGKGEDCGNGWQGTYLKREEP